MRSVRCDQCGSRAMLAASQCPHCSHLFELRDTYGEFVPLGHCATCDSYYPLSQGECRWCGTKPESFRIAPYAWRGVGVLAGVGLGLSAWLANRNSNDDVASPASTPKTSVSLTTQVDSGTTFVAPLLGEIADPAATDLPAMPTSAVASDTTYPETVTPDASPPAPLSVESEAVEPTPGPAPGAGRTSPLDRVRVSSSPSAGARTVLVSKPSVVRSGSSQWVRATARRWVTVRAAATPNSRIVASIGPDTRVQLGEARGDWRRIRTKGITGWIPRSQF